MGANRSYDPSFGGVRKKDRTHEESNHTILGHKVLLQKKDNEQAKNVLNSNSDSPIYIIGRRNNDGTIEIHSVNVFDGHHLCFEINLKYDSSGKLKAYNGTEACSHGHSWRYDSGDGNVYINGNMKHEPIPSKYAQLLTEIVNFNNKHLK